MTKKTAVLKAPAASRKEIKLTEAMTSIDHATEAFATEYNLLRDEMVALNAEIKIAKDARMANLRKFVASSKAAHAELAALIEKNKAEFDSPRTRTLHGFKVGIRKLEGKMVFDNEETAIKLIEKHFADQFDVLVATSYSVVKDAVGQLPAADLKRLGGRITNSTDTVVIKSAAGDVEKMVDALIAEKADEADQ